MSTFGPKQIDERVEHAHRKLGYRRDVIRAILKTDYTFRRAAGMPLEGGEWHNRFHVEREKYRESDGVCP